METPTIPCTSVDSNLNGPFRCSKQTQGKQTDTPAQSRAVPDNFHRNCGLRWNLGLVREEECDHDEPNDQRREHLCRCPRERVPTEGEARDGERRADDDDGISPAAHITSACLLHQPDHGTRPQSISATFSRMEPGGVRTERKPTTSANAMAVMGRLRSAHPVCERTHQQGGEGTGRTEQPAPRRLLGERGALVGVQSACGPSVREVRSDTCNRGPNRGREGPGEGDEPLIEATLCERDKVGDDDGCEVDDRPAAAALDRCAEGESGFVGAQSHRKTGWALTACGDQHVHVLCGPGERAPD